MKKMIVRLATVLMLVVFALPAKAAYYHDYDPNYMGIYSANYKFEIHFGQMDPNWDNLKPEIVDTKSEFYKKFQESVLRAMNYLETTLQNKPSRTLKVYCAFDVDNTRQTSAYADPWWSQTPTYGNLGVSGIDASTVARVSDIEYVWKYGKSSTAGLYDVLIYYSSPTAYNSTKDSFGTFWVEESTDGFTGVDVTTVTLHEIGHALCFYSGKGFSQVSSLDRLMVSEQSKLPGGGLEWYFTGEMATKVNGGNRVEFMPGANFDYDPHIKSPSNVTMCDGTKSIGAVRSYSAVELAMFHDMGWTVNTNLFTGIDAVETDEAETKEKVIYDLFGRKVRSIENPGIYIVNGKKTIVR